MATQAQALQPAAISDLNVAFSFVSGTTYNLQSQGGVAYVAEAASAPDLTGALPPFRRYRDGQEFPYEAISGMKLFAWGSGRVVCDEA